jgi:hypothetical protein
MARTGEPNGLLAAPAPSMRQTAALTAPRCGQRHGPTMASDAANDRAIEQFGARLITTDSFTLVKQGFDSVIQRKTRHGCSQLVTDRPLD